VRYVSADLPVDRGVIASFELLSSESRYCSVSNNFLISKQKEMMHDNKFI